jgi:hypothetical protein
MKKIPYEGLLRNLILGGRSNDSRLKRISAQHCTRRGRREDVSFVLTGIGLRNAARAICRPGAYLL